MCGAFKAGQIYYLSVAVIHWNEQFTWFITLLNISDPAIRNELTVARSDIKPDLGVSLDIVKGPT